IDGLGHLCWAEPHESRSSEGDGYEPVADVVPPSVPDISGVAESTLKFIGQDRRKQEVLPADAQALRDREGGPQVIARVRGLFGEVGVVEVEVPYHESVDEGRGLRRGLPSRPEYRRGLAGTCLVRDCARDPDGRLVVGTNRAPDRVDRPALRLGERAPLQVGESERGRIPAQLLCEVHVRAATRLAFMICHW